jgi:hypothetical protein
MEILMELISGTESKTFEARLSKYHEGKKYFICQHPSMADSHVLQVVYDYFY